MAGAGGEHHPVHDGGGVVQGAGGELELVVEAVGLGQEGVLEHLTAARRDQCRRCGGECVSGVPRSAQHGREARVLAQLVAEADDGVARVVKTEQLAEEPLQLAEQPGGAVASTGQGMCGTVGRWRGAGRW